MQKESRYYVYAHYIDGKCFYIGKGTRSRYKITYGRNTKWTKKYQKGDEFKSIIIENDLLESEALLLEQLMVSKYNPECNLVCGGGGCRGLYVSKETRLKSSLRLKGKKQSKELIEKRMNKIRKPIKCIELDKIFTSITEASKSLNIDNSHISKVLNNKLSKTGGYTFEYVTGGGLSLS